MIQEIVKEGNEKTLVLLGRNVKRQYFAQAKTQRAFHPPPSTPFFLSLFISFSFSPLLSFLPLLPSLRPFFPFFFFFFLKQSGCTQIKRCWGFNFSNYLEDHLCPSLTLKPLLWQRNRLLIWPVLFSSLPYFPFPAIWLWDHFCQSRTGGVDRAPSHPAVSLIPWGLANIRGPLDISPLLATHQYPRAASGWKPILAEGVFFSSLCGDFYSFISLLQT